MNFNIQRKSNSFCRNSPKHLRQIYINNYCASIKLDIKSDAVVIWSFCIGTNNDFYASRVTKKPCQLDLNVDRNES